MAKLEVAPAEDEDFERLTEISLDAIFDPEQGVPGGEYVSSTWPGHDTPDERREIQSQLLAWKRASPPNSFMKVSDPVHNNEILGVAIWQEYTEPPKELPELEADSFDNPEDKRYAQHLRRENNKVRLRRLAAAKGPVIGMIIELLMSWVQMITVSQYSKSCA